MCFTTVVNSTREETAVQTCHEKSVDEFAEPDQANVCISIWLSIYSLH